MLLNSVELHHLTGKPLGVEAGKLSICLFLINK
uniref:Uncharacterized protein n=1 Tax=Anguilla anguilla TaxID=7936 RepID=A0A0E9QZ39_ANGAN